MSLIYLAWQYARSRALLWMSAVAIALGVAVLFTVQAVVNGYLEQVETSLRDFVGDAAIEAPADGGSNAEILAPLLTACEQVEGLVEAQPRLNWFGLVGRRGARSEANPRSADLSGLLLVGVDDCAEGSIRLGRSAAESLGVNLGEALEVISFHTGASGRPVPVRHSFTVGPSFTTGRFDQDLDRALVNRNELGSLLGRRGDWNQIILRADARTTPEQLAAATTAAIEATGLFDRSAPSVSTWRVAGGNFLRAVENQKGILQTIFFMVVLVAAYQLVATLTLTVAEKRRDIGVLGALGASPQRLVAFFVSLGLVVASLGTGLGILLGLWLCSNLETVELWLGGGEPIFTPEIYKFEHIPVSVDPATVAMLVAATLLSALVFSFIPAWQAARLPIVRALWRR